MKIYWSIKEIPELKTLPPDQIQIVFSSFLRQRHQYQRERIIIAIMVATITGIILCMIEFFTPIGTWMASMRHHGQAVLTILVSGIIAGISGGLASVFVFSLYVKRIKLDLSKFIDPTI